jgi:hypothetical protein
MTNICYTKGVTIPYYLLSQFFVESLGHNNIAVAGDTLTTSAAANCIHSDMILTEDCEKKLLAVEGLLTTTTQQQQQQKAAAVVLLLPPPSPTSPMSIVTKLGDGEPDDDPL